MSHWKPEDVAHCVATCREEATHVPVPYIARWYVRIADFMERTGIIPRHAIKYIGIAQRRCKLCGGKALYRVSIWGYCSTHRGEAVKVRLRMRAVFAERGKGFDRRDAEDKHEARRRSLASDCEQRERERARRKG